MCLLSLMPVKLTPSKASSLVFWDHCSLTNPKSVRPNVKSKEQWAMARVYAFVMKGKTYKTADKDLADKLKKKKIKGYIK